ncbi:hypothetical protein LguiA_011814 [Lonicera macranthoides]
MLSKVLKIIRNPSEISSRNSGYYKQLYGSGSGSAPSPKPATKPATLLPANTKTTVHMSALDSIVNVNSLFTIAVFLGLSLAVPNPDSSSGNGCVCGPSDVSRLIVYEVVSFSFFLSSSLIAQGLKLAINLLNSMALDVPNKAQINCRVLTYGMVGTAIGSVLGCVFLMLSMVLVIEVKLGKLACGGDAVWAAIMLIILVTTALVGYVSTTIHAFLD